MLWCDCNGLQLWCHWFTDLSWFWNLLHWLWLILRMIQSECSVHVWEYLSLRLESLRCMISLKQVVRTHIIFPSTMATWTWSLRRVVDIDELYLFGLYSDEAATDHAIEGGDVLLIIEYLDSKSLILLHFVVIQIAMRHGLALYPLMSMSLLRCKLLYLEAGLHVVAAKWRNILIVELLRRPIDFIFCLEWLIVSEGTGCLWELENLSETWGLVFPANCWRGRFSVVFEVENEGVGLWLVRPDSGSLGWGRIRVFRSNWLIL